MVSEYRTMEPPAGLDLVIARAMRKATVRRRALRFFQPVAIAIAGIWLTAAVCVNLSPALSSAITDVPGLRKMFPRVNHLRSANPGSEQNMRESSTATLIKDGVKLQVSGMVIDETGASIFYHLNDDAGTALWPASLNIEMDGQAVPATYALSNYVASPGEPPLQRVDIAFGKPSALPKEINFIVAPMVAPTMSALSSSAWNREDSILPGLWSVTLPVDLATFPAKKHAVNEEVYIGDQHMTIKNVDIYPTRTLVSFTLDEQNTSLISNLRGLEIVDARGERWALSGEPDTTIDGISMVVALESPYFSQGNQLNLNLNSVGIKDKSAKMLTINTQTGATHALPLGFEYIGWNNVGDDIALNFRVPVTVAMDAIQDYLPLFPSSTSDARFFNSVVDLTCKLDGRYVDVSLLLEVDADGEYDIEWLGQSVIDIQPPIVIPIN